MRGPGRSWVIVAFLLVAGRASAQDTGNNISGGNFDSPDTSSSSSSGGSDYSGSSGGDTSYGGSSSSDGGGGGSGGSAGGTLAMFLIIGPVIYFGWYRPSKRRRGMAPLDTGMHVETLMLALDWRARKRIQDTLAKLLARGSAGTSAGRNALLREVSTLLLAHELSWLYAAGNHIAVARSGAEGAFRGAEQRARSRYKQELARDDQGQVQTRAPENLRARAEEGPGVVVITLVTVARKRLHGTGHPESGTELKRGLENRGSLGESELVAISITWSPAADADRMSSAELEALYPELTLIDPKTMVGRVMCSFCGGPFALELTTCPHCGAAADKDTQATRKNPPPASAA